MVFIRTHFTPIVAPQILLALGVDPTVGLGFPFVRAHLFSCLVRTSRKFGWDNEGLISHSNLYALLWISLSLCSVSSRGSSIVTARPRFYHILFIVFFFLCYGSISGNGQWLLLVLCIEIIPGRLTGTNGMLKIKPTFHCMQGKCPTHSTHSGWVGSG